MPNPFAPKLGGPYGGNPGHPGQAMDFTPPAAPPATLGSAGASMLGPAPSPTHPLPPRIPRPTTGLATNPGHMHIMHNLNGRRLGNKGQKV